VVKRRTLGDGLTPDEEQFLHATVKIPKPESAPDARELKELVRKPSPKKARVHLPASDGVSSTQLQTGMMGLNTRVAPQISAALLRASVDRKIERRSRAAVQDIVNEALTEWLTKAGYIG
jgi:hypothetical protein